jgi:anti-sigma regulatory factor (Ser/Thr protein kinase)
VQAGRSSGKAFPILGRSEVVTVSSHAGRMARELGFDARRAMELAIVVSELASNIVKHGVQGEIILSFNPDSPPQGEIIVEAHDVGPPIRDLKLAMIDGNDDQGPIDPALILRRGGLGTGLGAVARLADRLEYRDEEGGKTITARFYRR